MVQQKCEFFYRGQHRLEQRFLTCVRHIAWLNAVPEDDKDKRSRYEILKKEKEHFEQSGQQPELLRCVCLLMETPDIPDSMHIYMEYMNELGFFVENGFGISPLPYAEIKAWAELQEISLTPFESRLLRRISQAYVSQYNISSKSGSESPYRIDEQRKRKDISAQIIQTKAMTLATQKPKRRG